MRYPLQVLSEAHPDGESTMDSPLEHDLDYVVEHIKAEIDKIAQVERSKNGTKELIAFIYENNKHFVQQDGDTILHRFLYDGSMADKCPPEILHAILHSRPECILMNNGQDVPLHEFIRRNSTKMTRAIVQFVASNIKTYNLAQLDEDGERLLFGEANTEVEPSYSRQYGKEVIQAAFNFCDKGKLLPLDIDLLEMLVKLATPEMLQKGHGSELSPLEQALRYGPVHRAPEATAGTCRTEVSHCPRSVYRWHVATKESWDRRRKEQLQAETDSRTNNRGPAAPPQMNGNGGPGGSGVTGKDRANGALPKSAPLEKGGPSAHGASPTIGMSISQHKFGKSSMSKRAPAGGLRPGVEHPIRPGPQKEGQRLQPMRMGPSNRRMANEARVTKQDIDAANEASETILRELGLRFLRWTLFSGHQKGTTFEEMIEKFFGNEKHHYYFALDATKVYEDMTESLVQSYFSKRKHYHVLRHVVLPRARILLESGSYTDQLQFFHWFRSWKVEKILKVVVDDRARPHGDEKIEEVLAGLHGGGEPRKSFDVEVLDWRKEDLCPETIRNAAPQVRELHLYWSGNNSVLRGWSEPEGLRLLESLRTMTLSYNLQGVSRKRVEANVAAFKNRMQRPRPRLKAVAEEPRVKQPKRQTTRTEEPLAGQTAMTSTNEKHDLEAWLPEITIEVNGQITTGRVSNSNSAASAEDAVEQRWFKVALIDDGVDIFSKGMRTLQSRFLEGRSFDRAMADGPSPVFSSFSGHGTFMAKSILRVCPCADIVPYRLTITPDPTGKLPRPEPGSAAKAIRAAILQGVDIISMSWTIRTDDNERVTTATRRAGSMAWDFPRDIDKDIFCIGAANSSGQVWPDVTDQSGLQFIFPGVDIKDVFEDDGDNSRVEAASKNSQLGDLMSKREDGVLRRDGSGSRPRGAADPLEVYVIPTETINAAFVDGIATFAVMKTALAKLGVGSRSGPTHANPADDCSKATKGLKDHEMDGPLEDNLPKSLGPIATLCRN
ncbi:hypothetical protein CSOJ01_13950 [Colletotrichum sojae]|uniref:Peptidase S8/S53 domain-containing protein n=1 Tax=Colletotrichum sojae TaxID=2175907 RepID=A0A8H6IR99_9PEZI|nr:hypothetical protein CSOJ01_13950 [Colletotrichum sojae]